MCVFKITFLGGIFLENCPQEFMNEPKPTLRVPLKITSSFPVNFEHYKSNVLLAGSLSADEMLSCWPLLQPKLAISQQML